MLIHRLWPFGLFFFIISFSRFPPCCILLDCIMYVYVLYHRLWFCFQPHTKVWNCGNNGATLMGDREILQTGECMLWLVTGRKSRVGWGTVFKDQNKVYIISKCRKSSPAKVWIVNGGYSIANGSLGWINLCLEPRSELLFCRVHRCCYWKLRRSIHR